MLSVGRFRRMTRSESRVIGDRLKVGPFGSGPRGSFSPSRLRLSNLGQKHGRRTSVKRRFLVV